MNIDVKFRKVVKNAKVPTRANHGDAGYDIFACEKTSIEPMCRKLIPVGICVEIPEGYYGRIAPRSGLSLKNGVDIMAGVIDSGYRDELKVLVINLNLPDMLFNKSDKALRTYGQIFGSQFRFEIYPGDRIAQLIIEKCHSVNWIDSDSELGSSDRGVGGFGSSGV